MTRMLASVTGPAEAEIAIAGGVDIVDLKDPSAGALGAVSLDVVKETVASVAGRRPVSAVAGDLPMEPARIRAAALALAATGVDFVKIGFFPSTEGPDCAAALADAAKEVRLIGVLFADLDPDFGLLPALAGMVSTVPCSIPPTRPAGGCSTICRQSMCQASCRA